jgi:hypothetical protein
MDEFSKIYLAWRPGRGERRIFVGEISKNGGDVSFKYLREGLHKARREGFDGYPGLSDDKMKHENTLSLFAKRIINTERSDAQDLLDFWEVEPQCKNDKFYILAMTQGLKQTDNFEFVAVFEYVEKLNFVTDIAGIRYSNFDLSKLKAGDMLYYEREPDNEYDKFAVKTIFKQEVIGYIKQGHNEVFEKDVENKIKIEVKDIRNIDSDKQLFVRVYIP